MGEPDRCPFGVRIQFDELSQRAGLEDFIAPIRIGTDLPYANAARGGEDVVFRSPDLEEVYPHEIDTWRAGGESVFWVRLPLIDDERDQILLCVGAEGPANPGPSIWHDFSAVWHFGEATDASPRLVDHSGNGLDAEPETTPPIRIDSALGGAARADTPQQSLAIAQGQLLLNVEDVTVEVVYSSALVAGYDELFRQQNTISVRGHDDSNLQSSVELLFGSRGSTVTNYSGATTNVAQTHYLTATYAAATGRFEVCMDGRSVCNVTNLRADLPLWANDRASIAIGREDYTLDELRVSTVVRSNGWIEATDRGIRGTLLTFLDL